MIIFAENNCKVKSIATLLIAILAIPALAQKSNVSQFHGNFSLGAAAPLNEFKDNTTTTGFGVNLNGYIPFQRDIPIYFGFGFGYYLFGSNSQDIHENLEVRAGNTVISNIPIDLRVETNNNLVNGFAGIRVMAPLEIVRPYFEIKGGFNYLYTRTKVLDESEKRILTDDGASNEINSRTASSGFTYAYGAEAGFIIKPWENFGINISGAYMLGGRTEYYDESQTRQWTVNFSGQSGTFDPNNIDPKTLDLQEDAAEPRESITDMLLINLGVTYFFPTKNKKSVRKPAQ